MPTTHALAVNLLDPHSLLASFGPAGVFVVLLAETGLLVGIFLPGDSLLFTAGLLCATRSSDALHLSLPIVLAAAVGGALIGAQVGYLFGRHAGPPLIARRRGTRLRAALARGQTALVRYGPGKALVLARFIPFVRTVMNPLAGVLGVPVRVFTVWQVVGGAAWSVGVTLAGFGLGSRIPGIDSYLLPIIAVIVVVSLVPVGWEILRARHNGTAG